MEEGKGGRMEGDRWVIRGWLEILVDEAGRKKDA